MPKNKEESGKKLDKETLDEIMDEAVKNYKDSQIASDEVNIKADIPNKNKDSNGFENPALPLENSEEIDAKIEDIIDITGSSEILNGIQVNVTKNEDGEMVMSLQAGDFEKTEPLNKENLLESICTAFTSFIQDAPLDVIDNGENSDELNNEESDDDELPEINELEDINDLPEPDNEDDELDVSLESSTRLSDLANLRSMYSSKVMDIFEHGLEAKSIALDMVKDSILANSIGELITKNQEKDTLIANKTKELNNAKVNLILAKKMNKNLNKVYSSVLANINNVKDDLTKGLISSDIAQKSINAYCAIVSKVLVAKKPETLIAGIKEMNKVNKAILANKQKMSTKTNIIVANKKSGKGSLTTSEKDKFYSELMVDDLPNIYEMPDIHDNTSVLASDMKAYRILRNLSRIKYSKSSPVVSKVVHKEPRPHFEPLPPKKPLVSSEVKKPINRNLKPRLKSVVSSERNEKRSVPTRMERPMNIKPMVASVNVMNSDGMNDGTLAERHRGPSLIDQMTAEITRISGLD